MVAGVPNNPLCAEPSGNIDIASEIAVDGLSNKGRIFCDVDRRKSVQAKVDIMFLACLADACGTRVVEARQGIVGRVELDIDVADLASCRPRDSFLNPETPPDIDPDPVPQHHVIAFDQTWAPTNFSRNQLRRHLVSRR